MTSKDPYHITHANEELPPEPDVIELTGNTLEVSITHLVQLKMAQSRSLVNEVRHLSRDVKKKCFLSLVATRVE